jgi:hypothetical protein
MEEMRNKMDQDALMDEDMLKSKLMMKAKEMDAMEEEALSGLSGDFSVNGLNRLVDALNQANRVFKAPTYPRFKSAPEVLPPEFLRNLEMVNAAVTDAGLDDYKFDLSGVENDTDLKMIAGKIDAASQDKSFKAFLNKPQGMGDIQAEMDMPVQEMSGEAISVSTVDPSKGEDEEELFMARMKA